MQRVLSRQQMREFDRLATTELGIPSVVLMENAGRGAAVWVLRELRQRRAQGGRVAIVCGGGNNGGDGYVVARRLALAEVSVEVVAIKPESSLGADALLNRRAFSALGGLVTDVEATSFESLRTAVMAADLVVDAVFGTGLNRTVEGLARRAIDSINQAPGVRVALDLPSGLDADTGIVHGSGVRADLTVTFAAHKLGLLTPNALAYTGRIELVDIGVPQTALSAAGESARLLQTADVAAAIGQRTANAHKSSSGRVLVLAGSPGKIGAALLVAHGALRAGAGLVTLAALPDVAAIFEQRVLEAMVARLNPEALEDSLDALLSSTDAVAIGPGLGFSESAQRIVERVVLGHEGPVVVDADAISHFKGRREQLAGARGKLILTPHAGELARLLEEDANRIDADRFEALARAIETTKATVLLKGAHTLTGAPQLLPVVGSVGSAALATGGTGDVLTGVIAALACSLPPATAAYCAAYLHACAGRLWSSATGADRGLLAHEVADHLPQAIAELSGRGRVLTD